MEYPNYYAIIPARVRYSDIKPSAKLLYGEITCLTNKKGYCFATNNYFANLYQVNKNTISLWIKELKDNGFISVELIYKDKQIIERRIGIIKNNEGGVYKKQRDNNIKNNTINNISLRKMTDVSVDVLKEFSDYWTEQNPKGTKMRFEMEKTFDINLRLKRWCKNNQKWNKPTKKSKLKTSINTHQKAKEMIRNLNNNSNG